MEINGINNGGINAENSDGNMLGNNNSSFRFKASDENISSLNEATSVDISESALVIYDVPDSDEELVYYEVYNVPDPGVPIDDIVIMYDVPDPGVPIDDIVIMYDVPDPDYPPMELYNVPDPDYPPMELYNVPDPDGPYLDESARTAIQDLINQLRNGQITARQMLEAIKNGIADLDSQAAGDEFKDFENFVNEYGSNLSAEALTVFNIYKNTVLTTSGSGIPVAKYNEMIDEMSSAARPINQSAQEYLNWLDKDGDGSVTEAEYNEVRDYESSLMWYGGIMPPFSEWILNNEFSDLDINSNGNITLEEIRNSIEGL